MSADEKTYKQLKWRCRRGMRELDILLLPFIDEVYRDLDPTEIKTFERLLEHDDPDLMRWFSRREQPPDDGLVFLVDKILDLSSSKLR